MKIRNGFVSNSSSASFIIGVGKVIDEDTIVNFCKQNNIRYTIRTVKEILEYHKSIRHLRGGEATKIKYKRKAGNKEVARISI